MSVQRCDSDRCFNERHGQMTYDWKLTSERKCVKNFPCTQIWKCVTQGNKQKSSRGRPCLHVVCVDTNENMITPSLQLVTSDSLETRLVLITHRLLGKHIPRLCLERLQCTCNEETSRSVSNYELALEESPDRCINYSNQTLRGWDFIKRNHSENHLLMTFVICYKTTGKRS